MLLLQISVSLLFLFNKVLVAFGKRSGWLLGVIAAALCVVYFLYLDLYVLVVLEVGLVLLMGNGYLGFTSTRVVWSLRGVVIIALLAMTVFAFSGALTIVELASSIGMLVGTYWLTHTHARLGWVSYTLAHLLAAYITYVKAQHFFAVCQVLSAAVCLYGLWKDFRS